MKCVRVRVRVTFSLLERINSKMHVTYYLNMDTHLCSHSAHLDSDLCVLYSRHRLATKFSGKTGIRNSFNLYAIE